MPTTENRVPNQTITLTINGSQIELPAWLASIGITSSTEEEFSTILRGVLAIPGAGEVRTAAGVSAVVRIGDETGPTISVLAPASIRDARPERSFSPALDAAIADAVNVTGAAA